MRAYRLCRELRRDLDGEGARLYGGRWNSPGRAVVYTSSSLSLAAIEYLVHIDPRDVPNDLIALTIHVRDDVSVQTIDEQLLPPGWERIDSAAPRLLGDEWLDRASSAVLRVPSAPIPRESNLLLNAAHHEFARIHIEHTEAFSFDPRLL